MKMSLLFIMRLQKIQNFVRWQDGYTKTLGCRLFAGKLKQNNELSFRGKHSLQKSERSERSDVSTDVKPLAEKIKEGTKTLGFFSIILVGVGITSVMFWAIFRELFSSTSPNNVYSKALDRVKDDPRVQDSLGAPIKGYGEESRRRRRQHVAHQTFERNGIPHMRMHFYVQGIRNKATVHLEIRENSSGKMEYRYLFVQLDHYPKTTIILEDNRAYDPQPNASTGFSSSNLELASFDKK